MASITVTPIRRLARGVAVIRDTEDKEELKDHVIVVSTRDEIGSAGGDGERNDAGAREGGDRNKAAPRGYRRAEEVPAAGEGQPGGEASTAMEENARLEIFGYYKGAKGVSGDYFDFKRLDDTHYALIKCDVSGKGVSAALIMVEVATLFINYFRDWPKRKENITQIKDPKAKAARPQGAGAPRSAGVHDQRHGGGARVHGQVRRPHRRSCTTPRPAWPRSATRVTRC